MRPFALLTLPSLAAAMTLFGPATSLATPLAAPPDPAQANAAVLAYQRGAFRYQGTLGGPDLRGRLLVSLSEARDGTLAGEALLLSPDRRLLAASPVSGRLTVQGCHLGLVFAPDPVAVDGICTPTVIGGRLRRSPPPQDFVSSLLFWWDDRSTDGQAWLASGGSI